MIQMILKMFFHTWQGWVTKKYNKVLCSGLMLGRNTQNRKYSKCPIDFNLLIDAVITVVKPLSFATMEVTGHSRNKLTSTILSISI